MNIYLVTQPNYSYDEFDSVVITAKSTKGAIKYSKSFFRDKAKLSVDKVGILTDTDYEEGETILRSFNAG